VGQGKQKTVTVAKMLGKYPGYLITLVRQGRIPEPERDESGHYWWGESDVQAARLAMRTRQGRPCKTAHPTPN
jgi:hypothetical protein